MPFFGAGKYMYLFGVNFVYFILHGQVENFCISTALFYQQKNTSVFDVDIAKKFNKSTI